VRNLTADRETTQPAATKVVVVGGGAAGVITAVHLLRAADPKHPVDVRVIEKDSGMGPGLAYRTTHPLHTLNNFAGRLSAIDGDPDHLLHWCAERGIPASPTTFLQREVYGRYLSDVLDDASVPAGSLLRRTRGVVTDVREDATALAVQMSCGWTIPADKVVLALGNPPPRRQERFEAVGGHYVPNPWAAGLVESVGDVKHVLLLGTGLTMVDVVATLHESSPGSRFTAVSRHGLLPSAHKRGSLRLHDIFDPGADSLDEVIERVRERILDLEDVGGDWRDVVDSVRACANDLWRGFSPQDQDRFVTQLARHWEISRHRMSPDMAAYVEQLQRAGTLRVARIDEVDVASFDRVVNCTGPSPVPTRGWNRLVDSLLERGAIRPHRLGLGLDLTDDGNIIDADGRANPHVFAVGAARRGIEWEVGAIPDLRGQAARLASDLVTGSTSAAPDEDGRAEVASA
jgi:uncharacterized NAD(P)/FAD-binding protein YdhS